MYTTSCNLADMGVTTTASSSLMYPGQVMWVDNQVLAPMPESLTPVKKHFYDELRDEVDEWLKVA